jgi:hypothetical protein
MAGQDMAWKVGSAVSMGLAGIAAAKIVEIGWKAVTGKAAPVDPDDPGVSVAEIVVFAIVSGALLGLSRQLAALGAKRLYAGSQPKRLE